MIQLKESLPAFYGQTLKDIGHDEEFDKNLKSCREDYQNYTAYCIGLETQHEEKRASKQFTEGSIVCKLKAG